MPALEFPQGRCHDLACLGRLAVDLVMLWTVPALLGTAVEELPK